MNAFSDILNLSFNGIDPLANNIVIILPSDKYQMFPNTVHEISFRQLHGPSLVLSSAKRMNALSATERCLPKELMARKLTAKNTSKHALDHTSRTRLHELHILVSQPLQKLLSSGIPLRRPMRVMI